MSLASIAALIDDSTAAQLRSELLTVRECDPAVDLNAHLDGGETLLTTAVHADHIVCTILFLLETGVDPNAVNADGRSPLEVAVQADRVDVVKEMVLRKNLQLLNSLTSAAALGRWQCLEAMLAGNLDIDVDAIRAALACANGGQCTAVLMKDTRTPPTLALQTAVQCGDDVLLDMVLARQTEVDQFVNSRFEDGSTPLIVAAERGHDKCVAVLLASPQIDVTLRSTTTELDALHTALEHDRSQCVMLILKARPDLVGDRDRGRSTTELTPIDRSVKMEVDDDELQIVETVTMNEVKPKLPGVTRRSPNKTVALLPLCLTKLRCDKCSFVTVKKKNLARHRKNMHDRPPSALKIDAESPTPSLLDDTPCVRTTDDHGRATAPFVDMSFVRRADGRYHCPKCAKTLIVKRDMQRHYVKHVEIGHQVEHRNSATRSKPPSVALRKGGFSICCGYQFRMSARPYHCCSWNVDDFKAKCRQLGSMQKQAMVTNVSTGRHEQKCLACGFGVYVELDRWGKPTSSQEFKRHLLSHDYSGL